jgi:hypothetical protein
MLGMTPGGTAAVAIAIIIGLVLLGGQIVTAIRDVRVARHTRTDPSAARANAEAESSKAFWGRS